MSEREESTMTENNEPSLDEMLKAIPKLNKDDLEKLYWDRPMQCPREGSCRDVL